MAVDKCFTKKNKNGGNYTTCVDKKGDQLREKDVKPKKKITKLKIKKEPAAKPIEAKPAPKKKITKLVMKTKPLENISANMSALSASAPTAPPANYNMLRPEIRRNILEFAGAKSPIDAARDELIELATGKQHGPNGKLNLDTTYVFFVINNTLDKIGSRNLGELDIATTYKTSPRARKIFLRDPIEVLKEYRKRTGEVKYKKVIEMTLNRMKVYYKLMKTAEDATPGITPYTSQYQAEIVAIVKKNKNLFKNNFFPNPVKELIQTKRGPQRVSKFRTNLDGIKDYIDGGLNFDYTDPMDVVVSFDRMYINIKSNADFTKLIKEIHTGIKNVKERVLMGSNERDMKNLLAEESKIEFELLQEEALASKAKYKSQMEALAKSQNKSLENDGEGGFYLF